MKNQIEKKKIKNNVIISYNTKMQREVGQVNCLLKNRIDTAYKSFT